MKCVILSYSSMIILLTRGVVNHVVDFDCKFKSGDYVCLMYERGSDIYQSVSLQMVYVVDVIETVDSDMSKSKIVSLRVLNEAELSNVSKLG